jgi:hypothetical protein
MDQISSYATLQSAVAGTIHRPNDTNITANVPLFIQLCEADLNDRLLLREMESDEPLTLTLNQNYVALPAGFISPIAFWLVVDSQRVPLKPLLPQQLPYDTSATQPAYWAIDGANIRFDCPAGSAYSAFLRCIKTDNLSASNTSNALLLKRPDVYLFGTLKQAALFAKDDNDAQKWGAMYEQAIRGLKAAENRSRSFVPMRTDIPSGGNRGNIFRGE